MATLDEWTGQVCAALGLEPDEVDQSLVLDLARDTAHAVARPAAPLTAYLLGLAVGLGSDPAQAAATITGLANSWSRRGDDPRTPPPPADQRQL